MLFSIIIPTYNPSKYLDTMLNSLLKNDCANELEVIISDDCSTESINVDKFKDALNIICIKNDIHYGAPLNGRQNGVNIASGEWICFADQDDYFNDNAFDYMKEYIEKEDPHNYIVTDFYNKHDEKNVEEMIWTLNWTHGKFYEKTFWKEYGISYPKSEYCEDIGLSVLVSCILKENGLNAYYFPCFTYTWVQHEDSLSKTNGLNDKSYFYKSFPDYMKITLGTYIEMLRNTKLEDISYYVSNITSMILHLYFYFQGMIWQNEKDVNEYNDLAKSYFREYIHLLKIDQQDFIDQVNSNLKMYSDTRDICYKQIPFIETESFSDWVQNKL